MSKVWITNYAGHDFSAAEKYGEFEYITKGYVSFQSLDRVKFQIVEAVCRSDKDDWILLSGRPIISSVAILVWYQLHKQVKMLNWDEKTKVYRELIITQHNLDELLQVLGQPIYKSIDQETAEFQTAITTIHRQKLDSLRDSRIKK